MAEMKALKDLIVYSSSFILISDLNLEPSKFVFISHKYLQVRDFTRNPRDIQIALDDNIDPPFCETCDMGSVFDKM